MVFFLIVFFLKKSCVFLARANLNVTKLSQVGYAQHLIRKIITFIIESRNACKNDTKWKNETFKNLIYLLDVLSQMDMQTYKGYIKRIAKS